MKKTICIILILVFTGVGVHSQSIYNLTLDESIEIAKERSYSMLRLKQDLRIAEYNLKSATSKLKTHVDLSLTAPRYSEEIRDIEYDTGLSYYAVKQLSYLGNLTINQPLPTDGKIYIDNYVSTLKDMGKTKTNERYSQIRTRMGLSQPLDALYGYNEIKSTLKRAELDYEKSNKQLKREELRLIYQVSNAYYTLLSRQKRTDIAFLDLDRQTEAFDISQKKFNAGLIREVDALQMEVDLAQAQNDYDISIVNQISARNSFKEMLGIDLKDSIILNSQLEYDIVLIDSEKAVEMAMKNRLEIREQEIQLELQNLTIKQQKANGMVKASLDAHVEKAGVNPISQGIGFSNSFDQAFTDLKDRPINYGIGFTVKVPVFDWGENRAKVRAAEARLKQIGYLKKETERSIETEVLNLVANTNSNLKRLQLLEKNVVVAEKSFDITRQRYSDGDIDSQTLALERDRLNRAYTSHLDAYIAYQLSLADLMQKTFYDFKLQQVVE